MAADFTLQPEGTLAVLYAYSEAADTWCKEHLPDDAMRWAGGIVVEHRYVQDIVAGIAEDGLTVE
jgi:hypothetical protein